MVMFALEMIQCHSFVKTGKYPVFKIYIPPFITLSNRKDSERSEKAEAHRIAVS